MLNEAMLTTVDNPFNYFEQFDSWLMFDLEKGYQCCEKLAKVAKISDDMSQKEIDEEIHRAIDEIITYDFLDLYTKVERKPTTQAE